ncbi:MAG: alpha/beta hydrolase [Eubacterium sp.]|nr:alpha/beta hydrolase [Eubacterium sp.]
MFINVNGIKLHYEEYGSGQPLIMLHCNSMSSKVFKKSIPLLAKKYKVYAIDSRSHGKSQKVKILHYEDMAQDVYEFITKLDKKNPIIYGFSDGAIIGIYLAYAHPGLVKTLILSGASLSPESTKDGAMKFFKFWSHIDRSDKMKIMMREPDITDEMLKSIDIPCFVTAGSRDLIKEEHTRHLVQTLPDASLKIFDGESHSSYINRSTKIADYILSLDI